MADVRSEAPVAPAHTATTTSPTRDQSPSTPQPEPRSQPQPQMQHQTPVTYAQPVYPAQAVPVPFSKPWHWAKLGLMSASLVFSIILIALSVALTVGPNWGYSSMSLLVLWIGPVAVVAGLWDIAEFITICACGKRHGPEGRQGIHPGAHVGVDLCIWLAGVLCTFFSAMVYVSGRRELDRCADRLSDSRSSSSSSYYYYYCDESDLDTLQNGIYLPTSQAIVAFISLLTFIHFVIFVRACQETNTRNRIRRGYMMAPQMYYPPMPLAQPGYAHPMMPPPAHMGGTQAGPFSEKAPATATQPQGDNTAFTGFYAPPGPTAGPRSPVSPVSTPPPPRDAVPSSSTAHAL